MPEGRSEVIPPSARAVSGRTVLREVQDALGIPWVPETWEVLAASEPEVASLLWTRLQPVVSTGAFLRESLALLSHAFADLAEDYGSGEGVVLPEADRRGILLDLDALLYGGAQLLLQQTVLRLALKEEAVGRPGSAGSSRPRSAYRRRALEAVDETAAHEGIRQLFEDVSETLNLPSVPVDVRVVAKRMDVLEPAWRRLKRWRQSPAFFETCGALERRAEAAARRLSPAMSIDDRELVVALGDVTPRWEAFLRWVDLHAAERPAIILMDAFFRVEAAVHPERRARLHDADARTL
jgi:hypothetical protein